MSCNIKISFLLVAGLLCCSPLLTGESSAQPRKGSASPKKKSAPVVTKVDEDLSNVAELFKEKGEFGRALEIYDELRRDNPDDLDVLDNCLALCSKVPTCLPRLPELLDELEAFVKRHGKSKAAKQLLLDYSQELKDFKRARTVIKEIVKEDPQTPSGWLLLVDNHEELRDFKALDLLLLKLTKRFPTSPQVWLRVADRSLATNDLKGARAALKKAKRLIKPTEQLLPTERLLPTQLMALQRELHQVIDDIYNDYRQDTRWADLEDDFDHSTYP